MFIVRKRMGNSQSKLKNKKSEEKKQSEQFFENQGIDTHNKQIIDIACEQGSEQAFIAMTTDKDTGKPLTWSEIRARYG